MISQVFKRPKATLSGHNQVEDLYNNRRWDLMIFVAGITMLLLAAGCTARSPIISAPTDPIPVNPPPLPFEDNPDPTLCGIPVQDDRNGVVHGEVDGELAGPIVYFYESHIRQQITGQVYPGAEVNIILSQSNPTLDYYFVKTMNVEPPQEGWVPAPFVAIKS